MRHSSGRPYSSTDSKPFQRGDWRVIRDLLPYLLEYRLRVVLALTCLIAAKFANLGIPILMKKKSMQSRKYLIRKSFVNIVKGKMTNQKWIACLAITMTKIIQQVILLRRNGG